MVNKLYTVAIQIDNINLIKKVNDADVILVAGEALSHCVRASVTQLVNNIPEGDITKYVLLTDACSNVTGFESLGEDFVAEMRGKGMRVSTTKEYLA